MPLITPRFFLAAFVAAASPAAAQRPADHGSAVILLGQEPATPIPLLLGGSSANAAVADLLFLRLAHLGRTLSTTNERSFEPELARSWSRRDSLTLVFELDPRARWHDGAPVTSRDVLFSFGRMRDSTVDPQRALLLRSVGSVTAEGPERVVIRFTRAYAEQFYDATSHVQMLPAHLMDTIPSARFANSQFAREPVGNGPYRWVRRDAGQRLELAGNPGFFLGEPRIDRVVFLVVRDVEAALNLLLDGSADVYEAVPPITGPPRLAANPAIRLLSVPSFSVSYLLFNQRAHSDRSRPHPVLSDPEVRRAIAMAVDRTTLARSTYGAYAALAGAPVPQAHWTSRLVPNDPPFNPRGAAELLRQRGFRDGDGDGMLERDTASLSLRLNVPSTSATRVSMATQVQEQLRRVGVRIEIVRLDGPVWAQRRQRGEFDLDFSSAVMDPSPSGILQSWTCAGQAGSNHARFCDPSLDRLLEQAILARGSGEREWRTAYQALQRSVPAVFIASPNFVVAVHRRFRGVTIRPESPYGDLWRWSVDPARRIARDR